MKNSTYIYWGWIMTMFERAERGEWTQVEETIAFINISFYVRFLRRTFQSLVASDELCWKKVLKCANFAFHDFAVSSKVHTRMASSSYSSPPAELSEQVRDERQESRRFHIFTLIRAMHAIWTGDTNWTLIFFHKVSDALISARILLLFLFNYCMHLCTQTQLLWMNETEERIESNIKMPSQRHRWMGGLCSVFQYLFLLVLLLRLREFIFLLFQIKCAVN